MIRLTFDLLDMLVRSFVQLASTAVNQNKYMLNRADIQATSLTTLARVLSKGIVQILFLPLLGSMSEDGK